jgi:hypothetical protein
MIVQKTRPGPSEAEGQAEKSREERRAAQPSDQGVGALLQRDYVAVVEGSRCTPEEAVLKIRGDFPEFAPSMLAEFSRPDGKEGPLGLGDTMHIYIRGAGHCAVVASDIEPRSVTLLTLQGHIEAGRISFGASTDEAGRLVCRIRSRSRIGDYPRFVGYHLLGKHAQTRIWTTFLERLAQACGGHLIGRVLLSTDTVYDLPEDQGVRRAPTFEEADAGEEIEPRP